MNFNDYINAFMNEEGYFIIVLMKLITSYNLTYYKLVQ